MTQSIEIQVKIKILRSLILSIKKYKINKLRMDIVENVSLNNF